MQIIREMGIGINLGNTMESYGEWIWTYGDHTPKSYETAWGSPVITKDMLKGIKREGFGVMRLPVHWFNMMGANYTINSDYVARVKEIVKWAIDVNLYVILNIHHDENDFFKNLPTKTEETIKNYKHIWTQVAEAFKSFDDYLMFESLNEEACWGDVYNEWTGSIYDKIKAFDLNYQLNQAFIDVIRSSGGNNRERHLLLAGYCTDVAKTCDTLYKIPVDPMNRYAISMHYYTPSSFCILTEDQDWGKARSTWGTSDDIDELNKNLDLIQRTYIYKGIPVILGEYGATLKNKDYNSVKNFLYSVCKGAYDRNILPILWDVAEQHYDREAGVMRNKDLRDLLKSVKNNK
jgi:endoglucanase